MRKIFITVLVLFSLFIFSKDSEAKVLPQAQKSGPKAAATVKAVGIGVYPRMKDRSHLVVNFSNLQNASNVSYLLTYKTSTQDEGAMGGLNLNGSSNQSAELFFGTCSKNDCRAHIGVHDAKLGISYTLKSGKKYLKKYKIKV